MRNSTIMRRLTTAGLTLIALAAVGFVYAAWTSTGSGSGYAKAGKAQELSTLTAEVSTYANALYPGADGDVRVNVKNPNPYPVTVTKISAGSGSVTASGGIGTCTKTGVSLTSPQTVSIEVPAEGKKEAVLTKAAHMSNESENGCQEATFTIPVALEGASSAP